MKKLFFGLTLLISLPVLATSFSLKEGDTLEVKSDLRVNRAYEAWRRDTDGNSVLKKIYTLSFSCFNENGMFNSTECAKAKKDTCRMDIEETDQPSIIMRGESFEIKEIREISDSGSRSSIPPTKAFYSISMGSLGTGKIRTISCSRSGSSKRIPKSKLLEMISVIFN